MENDPQLTMSQEEGRSSRRGRLMGKIFGRDKKLPGEATGRDLNDFLHPTSDRLTITHNAPPPPLPPGPPMLTTPMATAPAAVPTLARLDLSNLTRYPNASDVANSSHQSLPVRHRSHSSHAHGRSKKGLVVRFADDVPEVIGEGGDECPAPVTEVGKRKRAKSAPMPPPHRPDLKTSSRGYSLGPNGDNFVPPPIKRAQTGLAPPDPPQDKPKDKSKNMLSPAAPASRSRLLDPSRSTGTDDNRRSFIEIHQAEQREAEGQAFAKAKRTDSNPLPDPSYEERQHSPAIMQGESPPRTTTRLMPESPELRSKKAAFDSSPVSVNSVKMSPYQPGITISRQASQMSRRLETSPAPQMRSPIPQPKSPVASSQETLAAADDALDLFVSRIRHLFELFRLHAETSRPISACLPDELSRASLWWFLKGRMALEAAIRDRPTTPEQQTKNELARQQAYADLGKAYWLSEAAIPEVAGPRLGSPDAEAECRSVLLSALKKMAVSMKRNGILPPEEAFLPQMIDKTIWIEYPPLSQDIVALLNGTSGGSALTAMQRPTLSMEALEALPLGDSTRAFSYGRVTADAFLMEQGNDSQKLYFSCILSLVRPQKATGGEFILACQNGSIQLRIQGNKNAGPSWDDVRWRAEAYRMDIKLPRGFLLAVQFSPSDYTVIFNFFDYGTKVQTSLLPRKDERVVFRSTLKSFQYFDSDPNQRNFPKDPVADCDVAMFEKVLKHGAATGPRIYHRGFRVAAVTGPRTKQPGAVSHLYAPGTPVQFGFLRGDQGVPALLLKFDNSRTKGSMVFSFNDEKDRSRLHTLLMGTALLHDEKVFAEVPLTGMIISERIEDMDGLPGLSRLPWQRVRVINEDHGEDVAPTVLVDRLRLIVDFKNGTITDRVNVAPGELKIRLDVKDSYTLHLLRHPQQDLTMAVSEAQVPRELLPKLTDALQKISTADTIRTFKFTGLQSLHEFQAALTGFNVLFDGMACTFAIARRRMVVPIHKKWEAGATRIQIIQQEKITQLLAFFQDFHHGQCMNFILKGTDVFESFSRNGKAGLKIDDAKFPLPRVAENGVPAGPEMAFVCLDMPDLPGEHDDITIWFESDKDRDQLIKCLPAPVKESRISRIR